MGKIDFGKILSDNAPRMHCTNEEYVCLKKAMLEACCRTIDLCAATIDNAHYEGVKYIEPALILRIKDQLK